MEKFQLIYERLARLCDLVQRGRYSTAELSSKLGVSVRQLQHYMRYLKDTHGIHIYFDRTQQCYCMPVKGKLLFEFRKENHEEMKEKKV
jgi:predicted DNA-binding transcriptional regulator YafY